VIATPRGVTSSRYDSVPAALSPGARFSATADDVDPEADVARRGCAPSSSRRMPMAIVPRARSSALAGAESATTGVAPKA
jgi:hypothetical protein